MPLFFITGSAGTGKTTVGRVLKTRGYEAYDVDEDGLAKWQHNQTGYIHPKSSVKREQRTPDFLANHSWNFPRQEAEVLAAKAENMPIFLCGALANEDELYDLFGGRFALYVDDEILAHRLATRTSGDWGKQPHELQHTLEHHSEAYEKYRRLGFIIVDATQPLESMVDYIIQETKA